MASNPDQENKIDLGHGFSYSFYGWNPDRELNPQYKDIPTLEKAGIIVNCPHGPGTVPFEVKEPWKSVPVLSNRKQYWNVKSLNPLTLEPSIISPDCGCHGYITDGKWVPC